MITFNPDKFGFYSVGSQSTYSKYEAFELSRTSNVPVVWNFNDNIFSKMDWKKEPETDLWEMYKQRARQIREAYDYVVLWYSGGSDSHNILMAWLEAGLKIDEIATTWNYQATGNYQNHYNAEITNVVLPDIKKLKDAGYDFNFRIVDISQFVVDLFDTWKLDFEYNVNFHFSPNNPAKHLFREKIDDYKNLIAQGKKLCFVWGKEKPAIIRENGKHYFVFTDNIDNTVGPYVQRNYYKGWYDELFYWTPDFPELPIKQAHVLNNFIKYCEDRNLFESINEERFQPNGFSNRFDMHLKDPYVKTVLYPKWSNDIFCNGKTASFTYSIRDSWFLKGNLDATARYMQISDSYFKHVDSENKTRRSIRPQFSQRYWIE
jgi:hypothetical protein